MKSTAENLEPTRVKLTVEVDYPELEPEMKEAYREIANQVNIPGFRKGHIPPRIIDQRFGRGAVIEQVINETLPGYLNQALVENEVFPLGQPEVEVEEIPATEGTPGGKLVFTAIVDTVPSFDLPNLESRSLQVPVTDVSEEDVDAELDELRNRFASLSNLERPAEDGDFLSLDLVASVDGEKIDSLADVSYELGSGSMMDGQDEALRGSNAGDEVEFVSTIIGGEYAGQDANIQVNVLSVKEKELPEVDDDFAMMVSEFDTVDELREDLASQVREAQKGRQAVAARDLLLEELLDETEIVLPENIVAAEAKRRVGEDADEEALNEMKDRISSDMRKQIFLDKLAESRQVQVAQQELIDFMMHAAQSVGMDLSTMLQDENQIQNMYQELARTKAVVSVLAETEVTDEDGNVLDLSSFTRDRAQAEPEPVQEEHSVVDEDGAFSISVDDLDDGDEIVVGSAEDDE